MGKDEAEVLKAEQAFITAWQAGDARACASLFLEDGVRVGAFGDIARGRAELEAAYARLFGGPLGGARLEWTPTVRLVSPEVALAEGPLTIRPPNGAPPLVGYALDVWRRQDGRWWLVEGHPKFYPPPPGQAPAR